MAIPNPGIRRVLSAALLFLVVPVWAGQPDATTSSEPLKPPFPSYEVCLQHLAQNAADALVVEQLRNYCDRLVRENGSDTTNPTPQPTATTDQPSRSPLQQRIESEQLSLNNPFSLLPHRPNYLLPLTYTQYPDEEYLDPGTGDLQSLEVQFQLSLKVVLLDSLYKNRGTLSFAYTTRSFWQAYNLDLSAPFRETNHQPELILALGSRLQLGGLRNVGNAMSLNHQSNGLGGADSRSWNRVIFQSIWEYDRLAVALRPWYRIPEQPERYPGDPRGDDNPDIQDYMGHFDLTLAYAGHANNEYTLMLRNNLSPNNKGALQFSWSFPLNERLRGRLQYFEGYGESLIDYDSYSRSVALGFEMSGWL